MPIPNSDFVPDPFPGVSAPAGTGAPGSPGAEPGGTAGPVVGTVQVNPAGLADGHGLGRVSVQVHSGDTSGMSHNVAANGSPLNDQSDADLASTGAGQGSYEPWHRYPWQTKAGPR